MKIISVTLLLSASVLLSAALSAPSGSNKFYTTNNAEADYKRYLAEYYKDYDPSTDPKHAERKSNFMKCRAKQMAWDETKEKYTISVNRFSHWTDEEFYNSLNHRINDAVPDAVSNFELPAEEASPVNAREITSSFSWVDQGAVTSVKDQGSCGCCYTFSAAAALEGAYFLKTKKLVNISTQQYVDCSYYYCVSSVSRNITSCRGPVCNVTTLNYDTWTTNNPSGNKGCNGGTPRACWAYNNMTGNTQQSWECYPFTSGKNPVNGKCQFPNQGCDVNVPVKGYVNVAANEDAVLAAVNIAPLACAIDSGPLQMYHGGVFDGKGCTSKVNHAITIVGYGTDTDGGDYWLIKNSWGPTWGEKGYFRLARGSNFCGIASSCQYPVVADEPLRS